VLTVLKGIETQAMIIRATDFVREADMQQRRNDVAREHQALQTQALAEHEQKNVTQSPRAQDAKINRDKQGKGGQADKRREQQETADTNPAEGDEIIHATSGNYIIDIKV